MKYVFAIWVIIVLVFLFFFSICTLAESGASSLLLAVLSGYGLFRILRHMYKGYHAASAGEDPSLSGARGDVQADPLEFIIFYDLAEDTGSEDRDDY